MAIALIETEDTMVRFGLAGGLDGHDPATCEEITFNTETAEAAEQKPKNALRAPGALR